MDKIISILSLMLNLLQYKMHHDHSRSKGRDNKIQSVRQLIRPARTVEVKWHPQEYERQRKEKGFQWTKDSPLWIGTIFAVIAAGISFLTWCEIARQADTAHDTLVAIDRPWISSVINTTSITDKFVNFEFHWINKGHSPAYHVFGVPIVEGFATGEQAVNKLKQSCASEEPKKIGNTIMPGDDMHYFIQYPLSPILANGPETHNKMPNFVFLFVYGCVRYTFADDAEKKVHSTNFVYGIFHKDSFAEINFRSWIVNNDRSEFAKNDLEIRPLIFGDAFKAD